MNITFQKFPIVGNRQYFSWDKMLSIPGLYTEWNIKTQTYRNNDIIVVLSLEVWFLVSEVRVYTPDKLFSNSTYVKYEGKLTINLEND